ncbi:MAG: P-loop NTPase [Oscillospiraceae bacterium]|nr:P-loop NTPase [Oscillospiraceae bacterium]
MGEAIAVLSGKGGTGKTSICAAVATALSLQGHKVLCIDCDVGLRNLDISLGLSTQAALSFLDICQGSYSLTSLVPHPEFPTWYFLTAPMNRSIDQIDGEAFGQMVLQARNIFDYVFLDAPAGVDVGFRLAAAKADRILLVTGSDPAAIRDAEHTGQLLELMEKTNVRLVVNRISPRLVSSMDLTIDDVMDDAGLPLLGIVPEDHNVILAAAFGKPLLKHTKKGAAAAAVRIAKRIQGIPVEIDL